MYKNIFFYILLGGYAFVDCKDKDLITIENYDLLYPIFASFIRSFCEEDYKMVIEMLHDSINLYNINNLVETAEAIDVEELHKAAEESQKLIEDLAKNKQLVEALKDIMIANDSNTALVIDELNKIASEKIKNIEEQISTQEEG